MMFDPKAFGSNLDSIDWLSKIGDWSTDELAPSNTVTAFNNKLAPLLNTQSDLVTFLGDLRKKFCYIVKGQIDETGNLEYVMKWEK